MPVATFAPAAEPQRWPPSVLWKLGGFILLVLLKGIDCLAGPSYNPSVNIYMSLEEVQKLLGKAGYALGTVVLLESMFGKRNKNRQ